MRRSQGKDTPSRPNIRVLAPVGTVMVTESVPVCGVLDWMETMPPWMRGTSVQLVRFVLYRNIWVVSAALVWTRVKRNTKLPDAALAVGRTVDAVCASG